MKMLKKTLMRTGITAMVTKLDADGSLKMT